VRVHPTISIGIAMLRADLPTPDHLLQAADEALYRAKRAGRNRVSR
jgi:diguanylate cyclase (GGDEF)-like protein